jgi:hypothetical protein
VDERTMATINEFQAGKFDYVAIYVSTEKEYLNEFEEEFCLCCIQN